jgi:hypothetical protein
VVRQHSGKQDMHGRKANGRNSILHLKSVGHTSGFQELCEIASILGTILG